MLLDTFYHLRRDYGTVIQYHKSGKGDVNPETGVRDNSADRTFPLDAVIVPVGHMNEWLAKLLGRVEKIGTCFLIRVSDIPAGITIESEDYFVHGNLKYKHTEFEDFGGVLYALCGETFT
jgi:hypothetical protein